MAESSKAASHKDGPVYFWKTHQGHGYLSQWFLSPWTHDGDEYDSTEKWMMVGKARLFGDEVLPLYRAYFNSFAYDVAM
jgi:predicted NAD-dependent protein-ADP-ribosyltransferase YbiA (DUF1768 family)